MKVSPRLYDFFQLEIRNERFGGDSPSTLASALDSAEQAPDHWFADLPGVRADLIRLVAKYGQDTCLIDFDKASPLEELAGEAE
jgi:hypothetical protein